MSGIPTTLTFQSLAKSGVVPASQASTIRAAYDRLIADGGDTSVSIKARAALHMNAAMEGVRQTGEAGVFGALLGAMHSGLKGGLDVRIGTSKIIAPIDGVGALVGLLAGAAAAAEPHGIGKTIQNGGAACMAIFSFRKTHDLMQNMKLAASGATPNGGASVGLNMISKAQFAGESDFGAESMGWAAGSKPGVQRSGFLSSLSGNAGEDSITKLARQL